MFLSSTESSQNRRRWMRRVTGCLVAAFLAAYAVGPAAGAATRELGRSELSIVVADDGEATRKVVADLRRRFPHAAVVDGKGSAMRRGLAIAVGPAALRALVAEGGTNPVVSVFTSSQVYRSILDAAGSHRAPTTAIFAEPAPSAQFRLINLLFKRPVRTTAVLSGRTSSLDPVLQHAAAAAKVPLVVESYGIDDSISRVLSRAVDSPAILAIPDSLVYTNENLRTVLLTTYRNGQAVIGFSAALVRAGALATTYSEVEDVDAQLEEIVAAVDGARMPDPQFPKYFRTVVNEDVARSLNLVVDDAVRNFANKPPVVKP